MDAKAHSSLFRQLHQSGKPLLIANAWDAASARLIQECGATAIATTSAGLDWARGFPDGGGLPMLVLESAVAEIARVLSIPLSVDVEGGYSAEPAGVGLTARVVCSAGAVGINLEDGQSSPDLLCAKIAAAKSGAAKVGVDLFVNARTDVFLRGLVPPEQRVAETVARGLRYQEAGADGLFVPGVADPEAIRAIATQVHLPLNVMVVPRLPAVSELAALGVRRVSAGSSIAQSALAQVRRATRQFLDEGRYEAMFETPITYGELNALFNTGTGRS